MLPPPQAPDPRRQLIRLASIACTIVGVAQMVVGAIVERAASGSAAPIITGATLAVAGGAVWLWDRFHDDDGGGGGGGGGRGRRELQPIYIPVENRPRYPGRQL